jgi:hypothetical protein
LLNHFVVLGIPETASDLAVEEAYRYLQKAFAPENFPEGSPSAWQAAKARDKIKQSYEALNHPEKRDKHLQEVENERGAKEESFNPKLGHICVAAGIITLDELEEAIVKQQDIDLPLGQILQEKRLLSQSELDGLLMGQQIFVAGEPRPVDYPTRRAMAMEVVTNDMIKIVLFDQRTSMSTLGELLIRRGWLEPAILDILVGQKQQYSAIN